ncbi:hypothetical protein VNO77_21815 [Canavalia gladiata]|uniref:Uncharacterized protein n=1 Tax=Canavalia gladiata TaxID=3824 RepID=A0AAN9Q9X9_CANGL
MDGEFGQGNKESWLMILCRSSAMVKRGLRFVQPLSRVDVTSVSGGRPIQRQCCVKGSTGKAVRRRDLNGLYYPGVAREASRGCSQSGRNHLLQSQFREYLNPDTLWERLNDAINTIIRRDDTTETGDLLPPCVEAALNLGCKPVRTSRSDRHNNPRAYLAARNQHPYSVSPKAVMTNPLNFFPVLDHQNNYSLLDTFASVHHRQLLAVETNPSLNFGSVYPQCYGFEAKEPPQIRSSNLGNTIFVGRPVIRPAREPSRMSLLDNLSGGGLLHVPNRIVKEASVSVLEAASRDRECDLSLRLGMFAE